MDRSSVRRRPILRGVGFTNVTVTVGLCWLLLLLLLLLFVKGKEYPAKEYKEEEESGDMEGPVLRG